MEKHSGFVSLIGKPNAGKSTLLNTLLGEELSVVTPKPQTTRNKIIGILTKENYQVVFLDTPGILEPKYKLQEFMKREIQSSFDEADLILFIIDVDKYEREQMKKTFERLGISDEKKVFCVLNKIDLVRKEEVMFMLDDISKNLSFQELIPVSAKKKFNTDKLLELVISNLPESEFFYDEEQMASQPEKFFVSEIIRGEGMRTLKEELPYSIFVDIDEFTIRERGKHFINASIIVDRDSHKKIVIGEGGNKIKRIGEQARKKIEIFLGKEIFLELFVKVKKNWRDDESFIKNSIGKLTTVGK